MADEEKPVQDLTTVALERTIFVGNLPNKLDHRDVAKMFKACGPVESARIRSVVPEKEKLSPKVALITGRMHPKVDSVNAYVVFAKTDDDECIKKALAMNGTVVDGHHIRVDKAQQANSKRLTLASRKKAVFVGNLRFDMRDDDLINHFQKVGSIDYVRLVRDRTTGLGKGFGFVKFMERADVKKALELNDSDFKGRKLRVKKIDEKMNKEEKKIDGKMEKGARRIDEKMNKGEKGVDQKTNTGEKRIDQNMNRGEKRIDQRVNRGEKRIDQKMNRGEKRIDQRVNRSDKRRDHKMNRGEKRIDQKVNRGEKRIDQRMNRKEKKTKLKKKFNK